MRFWRAACPVFGAACVLLGVTSACGSGTSSNVNGSGANGTGANGTGANGHAGTSTTTGPVLGLGGDDGTNNGDGGSSPVGEECAGDLVEAQRIPLDMYVMLDVSGSMTELTAGAAMVTKWQAVSSALSDFVTDPASDGIGMGLQVFPIRHPDAPASCLSNAECGDFGPCFLKACWGYDAALLPCNTGLDCGQFGPCIEFGN